MKDTQKLNIAKKEIIAQIGDLSKLLGMIPSDDTIMVNESLTQNSVELSKWFDDTRQSFLKLSVLLDRTLNLNLP